MGVMDLRRRAIVAGNPYREYQAIGNPATFNTNVARNLKSLAIPFTPIQLGTGDASPQNKREIVGWNGATVNRSGLNMWHFDPSRITTVKNTSNNNRSAYRTGLTNCTVTFSGSYKDPNDVVSQNINVAKLVNGVGSSTTAFLSNYGVMTATYTVGVGEELILMQAKDDEALMATGLQKANIQMEIGSSASTYTAYTGQTYHVQFPALGKNLFDVTTYPLTLNKWVDGRDGNLTNSTSNNYACTEDYIPVASWRGKTFTLNHGPGSSNPGFAFYDEAKTFLSGVRNSAVPKGDPKTFTVPNDAVYMRFTCDYANASQTQIEEGSSATYFEPFTNTAYNASLETVNGILTNKTKLVIPTALALNSSGEDTCVFRFATDFDFTDVISNCFSKNIPSGIPGRMASVGRTLYFVVATSELPSIDSTGGEAWIKSNGAVFLFTLSTAKEVQLPSMQIQTLIGANTVWTDTNGVNTIKYQKRG